MSGMFDSKSDKIKKKQERTKQEENDRNKTRKRAIIIIVVLLFVSAIALTINSNFIRRTVPVVTIDGVNFTTAEMEYFINMEYMDHVNMWSQIQGMEDALPDPNRPLSSQVHVFDENITWADFFLDQALNSLSEVVALYNAANASGFTLSEEHLAEIDEEMEMLEMQAAAWMLPSADFLLQQQFGVAMNTNVYRDILEFQTIARAYSAHVRESFEYSSQVLEAHYAGLRDDLDFINFRQVFVPVESHLEEFFDTTEEYEEAVQYALNEARIEAYALLEGVETEDDFIEAAREYSFLFTEPESTIRQTQGDRLSEDIRTWLIDDSRSYGDTFVTEAEHSQGYSVLFFVSRDDNNYNIVGMRQILISREWIDPSEFEDGEYDIGYIHAVEQAEADLSARAERVRVLFTSAGGREDALIDLMPEHSDDTTDGGYYPNIARATFFGTGFNVMRVVPEIEEWLFDESRVVGDWELIFTEAFGYHLVYFTGFYGILSELMAADNLRTDDHNEWLESLYRATPRRTAAFILVHV